MSSGKYIALAIMWAALAIGPAGTASARDIAQDVRSACAKDVESFCSQVTPGEGRLMACIYAHEDRISDGCDMALVEAGDKLASVADKVRSAVASCAGDIRTHCNGMSPGDGEIFQCLRDNKSSLSSGCGQVVDRIAARRAER